MRRFLGALATWALFLSAGRISRDGLDPLVLVALALGARLQPNG
jgi:hypothetical protein